MASSNTNARPGTVAPHSEHSIRFAKITKGYPYAFQLLGSLIFKNNGVLDKGIMERFDLLLEENVFSISWAKLTPTEKRILFSLAKSKTGEVSEILADTGYKNSFLQVYKKRLSDIGLLESPERGILSFALPRFKEFVEFQLALEEA